MAEERVDVVVLPLRSESITGEALTTLSELVVYSVASVGGYNVITPQDINEQLSREQMKDLLGCDATKCAAELGGALGARFLVAGSARSLGSNVMLTVTLIDSKTQKISRGQAVFENRAESFPAGVSAAVRDVFVEKKSPQTAAPVTANASPVDWVQPLSGGPRWQRCAVGQRWNGATCEGAPSKRTWKEAMASCPEGLRLATRAEYLALLGGCDARTQGGGNGDCFACDESETCNAAFGRGLVGFYWTATQQNDDPDRAWVVNVESGGVKTVEHDNQLFRIRCVRVAS